MQLELWFDGEWHLAAELSFREPLRGYEGRTTLSYLPDYSKRFLSRRDVAAVSCRYPVGFSQHDLSSWPPFALDLLPSGNARRTLLQRLALKDGPTADVALLAQARFSPGNIRVHDDTAVRFPPHPGFSRTDILERRDGFIEYAHAHGAAVAGSSGAQGDAPKFLLAQDRSGNWHSEGVLADAEVSKHWLVKFPRGRSERDKLVLRTEAAYMHVAQAMGLRTGELPLWEGDVLFVPRFDRTTGTLPQRFGMESLCSLAGVADFGARIPQETLCSALVAASSAPAEDGLEFLRRDVLNVMLGNTDNHARNSALLKHTDHVQLSPLYDFAPMSMDPEGISRSCRWTNVESAGMPDWPRVLDIVCAMFPKKQHASIRSAFSAFTAKLLDIPAVLQHCHVDAEVIAAMQQRITTTLGTLR